jgi:hypothetical protein
LQQLEKGMDLTDLTMILSTIQTNPSEEDFQQAVQLAGTLMMHIDDEQKICLYGLFKQCNEGDAPLECISKSPIDMAKW